MTMRLALFFRQPWQQSDAAGLGGQGEDRNGSGTGACVSARTGRAEVRPREHQIFQHSAQPGLERVHFRFRTRAAVDIVVCASEDRRLPSARGHRASQGDPEIRRVQLRSGRDHILAQSAMEV
jgi:hypothetical protein